MISRNPKYLTFIVDVPKQKQLLSNLRNGWIKTAAIGAKLWNEEVTEICAVTSKGDIATGNICVPRSELVEFCWRVLEETGEIPPMAETIANILKERKHD